MSKPWMRSSAACRGSARQPFASDQKQQFCPGLPWHNIRGIGNWLRHQYDRVELDTVWYTATVEIVPLKASVKAALQQLQGATEPPGLG